MNYEFDVDYLDEIQETYDYDEEDYIEDINQFYTLRDLWNDCLIPNLVSGFSGSFNVLICCLLLRFTCSLGFLPRPFIHVTSAAFGIYCLCHYYGKHSLYVIFLASLGYITVCLAWKILKKYTGPACAALCLIYIISCELFIKDVTAWHKVRGSQMILAMKLISIAFDIDYGVQSLPPVEQFFGYVFCVGNVIFGPWVTFHSYTKIVHRKERSLMWALRIIQCLLMAYLFLSISTCWTSWFFQYTKWKWIAANRDALSFRSSHYFIGYLSEVTAVMCGMSASVSSWSLPVVQPGKVEIPRSLVEVVTNWNLPFHLWLKTYVFKAAKPLGNFVAILLTYVASSLLHGLNFQLSAVLLSLGFYTYIEYVFRKKMAAAFNACILAKKCQGCEHAHKQDNPYVAVINLAFGLLTMFHLAYLGVMFDSSSNIQEQGYSMDHTLKKWYDLDFASHWVALVTYLFYVLI